jgi:hypothetical protein
MLGAEPRDRRVIRNILSTRHPERYIHRAQPFDLPRRPHLAGIRIHQQRDHHVRIERGPALTRPCPPRMQHRRVQLPDRVDQKPHQMITRQPLSHVRRQQEPLTTINRPIRIRHTQ